MIEIVFKLHKLQFISSYKPTTTAKRQTRRRLCECVFAHFYHTVRYQNAHPMKYECVTIVYKMQLLQAILVKIQKWMKFMTYFHTVTSTAADTVHQILAQSVSGGVVSEYFSYSLHTCMYNNDVYHNTKYGIHIAFPKMMGVFQNTKSMGIYILECGQ